MAKKIPAAGLLGMLGQDPAQQASTLLSIGTMGVVREMTRAADRRVAQRGGAPWTPSINRAKRQAAAAVRRQAPRGSVTRSAARAVAVSSRPNEVQRHAMRRESYRQQGESLTPEQLIAIPANELPPELVERQREAQRQAAEAQQQSQGTVAADSPATPQSKPPAKSYDQKIQAQLRAIIGNPDDLPPQHRAQLERQLAEKFGQPSTAGEPRESTAQGSAGAPEQRKREGVQTVVGEQVAGGPSPQTPAQQTRENVQSVLGPQPKDASPSEPVERVEMPSTPSARPAVAPEPPKPTPAQRRQEDVRAVVDSQLEDAPQPKRQPSEQSGGWLDKVQTGLDAAGVADPTPIADGTNAVISLGRAAVDPERRREHLQNAAISAVSAAVPYIGDTAKLLKVGRAAKKAHAARGAERAATRGAAHGSAESASIGGVYTTAGGAQPAIGGAQQAIGGAIRRMAGGAAGAMFGGDTGGRGGVRPQYSGGGQRPPGDHDQREGAPPIIEDEVRRNSSSGAPPVEPPRFGGPSPSPGDDGGNSPRRQREDAAGIAAHDTWTEKLKDGALAIAGFAGKAYLAIEGLQLFNRGVLALNKGLAQYSGTLAGSYAKGENADIRRDMKRAGQLSGPLSRLQEEQSKLQDTMSELMTPIQGTLIEILSVLTWGTNKGVGVLEGFFPKLTMALELLGLLVSKDEDEAPGGRQFLQDLSDGKFDGFGIDDLGKRFEILDKATRAQMGLTAQPKKPQKGKAPTPP